MKAKAICAAIGAAASLALGTLPAQASRDAATQTTSTCGDVVSAISPVGMPSGTRIYRVDSLEFKRDDGSGVFVTLPGDVTSYDDHSFTIRLRDGSEKAFDGYHFECRYTREMAVKPGMKLPAVLLGLEPVATIP